MVTIRPITWTGRSWPPGWRYSRTMGSTRSPDGPPAGTGTSCGLGQPEVECGPDGVLNEVLREPGGDGVGGLPSCAVAGNDQLRRHLFQRVAGRTDDWFEQRPVQVEPAEQRVDAPNAGEPAGVPADPCPPRALRGPGRRV